MCLHVPLRAQGLNSDLIRRDWFLFLKPVTFAARDGETEAYRNRESELERKIENLTRALADGYSQAITSELARTEAELERIRKHSSCPRTVAEQMRSTRQFVKSRLRDLRALFSAYAATVRAEIAKHVQKIVLTPEGRAYVASGSWNLLSWQHGWCRGPESLVRAHHPIRGRIGGVTFRNLV